MKTKLSFTGLLAATIFLGSLSVSQYSFAASDTWNQTVAGPYSWNVGTNWLSGTQFPNGASQAANVNIDIAGDQTITLGENITVGTLNLGDATGTSVYTLTGNQLIFSNAGSNAQLSNSATTNVINSTISLVDNLSIAANPSLTLGGQITGADKSISITGSGTVNFNATNNMFGGIGSTITASSGAIIRTNSQASFGGLGSGSNKIVLNGGTYFMGGNNDFGVSFNRAIEFQAGGTNFITVNAGASSREGFFFSTLTGTGGFSTVGTSAALIIGKNDGTSTLSGTVRSGAQSIYVHANATRDALAAADLNIQGGNFIFGGNSGTPTAPITLADFSRDIAVNTANGLGVSNNYTFTHTGTLTGASTLSINNITVQQAAVGSVGTINGAGANSVVVLNGNLTGFSGGLSVTNGTLRIGSSATLPTALGLLNLSNTAGVKADLNGRNVTFKGLTAGGTTGGNIEGNSTTTPNTLTVDTTGTDRTYSGIISDGGSVALNFAKIGANTQTLSGANTFSGTTTIAAGAGNLILGNSLALQNSTLDYISAGGTIALTPAAVTLGGLRGDKDLSIASKALTVGQNNSSNTYSGILSGASGSFIKTGAGTQTLSGPNSYTGGTTVSAGKLLVNNTTNSGTGAGAVAVNGGTLGGSGVIGGDVTINAGGTLSPGTSIESLGVGGIAFNGGTFSYEVDTSLATPTADLVYAGDNSVSLLLGGAPTLNLIDFSGMNAVLAETTKFTLFSYITDWDGQTFAGLANNSEFTAAGNLWRIVYNDTTSGTNFQPEATLFGTKFTTITAIPEPSSCVLLGLGLVALGLRRSSRRVV